MTPSSAKIMPKTTENTHLGTNQTEQKHHACERNQQKWIDLTLIYLFFNFIIFEIQLQIDQNHE